MFKVVMYNNCRNQFGQTRAIALWFSVLAAFVKMLVHCLILSQKFQKGNNSIFHFKAKI